MIHNVMTISRYLKRLQRIYAQTLSPWYNIFKLSYKYVPSRHQTVHTRSSPGFIPPHLDRKSGIPADSAPEHITTDKKLSKVTTLYLWDEECHVDPACTLYLEGYTVSYSWPISCDG